VDTAFASGATDSASLAAIQNAWLLVGLPIALLGQAIGQGAFPRLAAHAASGQYRELRRTLVRALFIVAGLAIVAIGGTLVLGRPVIRVLFEHGEFTAHDGSLTSQVLTLYAIGLPAYVATELLVRALIALHDARTQLITNSGQVALRIALVALLLQSLQVKAIPVALVVAASIEAAVLLVITMRRLSRFQAAPAAAAVPG
jgi:putative peptidoglycan lipid II flippase